jgi:hypothetical protein
VLELDVKSIDDAHAVAVWDRLLLQLWRGETTLDSAERLLNLGRKFVAERPGEPLCFLTIIESRSPPPNDAVRAKLAACFRELAPSMRHQIFVGEGSSFRVALIRGVGLAVSTLAPSLLPFKFASGLDEAAQAIAPNLTDAAGGTAGLKAAVTTLRRALDQRTVR